MNVEYINPFVEASQMVLKQMTGIDASLGKIYIKTSPYGSDAIAVIIGLTGNIRGQVIFSMNKTIAFSIASNMMGGMPINVLDELSKSAISELTNMILGNAATILSNKGVSVEITPPSVFTGDNIEVYNNKMKTVCIPLILNNDTVEIDVSIEEL